MSVVIEDVPEVTRRSRFEQLCGGIAISPASSASSGTLGCIVKHDKSGKPAILTNHHVIEADSDVQSNIKTLLLREKYRHETGKGTIPLDILKRIGEGGFPVFQPPYMGGTNVQARVVAFVTKTWKNGDAAICELLDDVEWTKDILGEGPHDSYRIVAFGQPRVGDDILMKSGVVTKLTWGTCRGILGQNVIIMPYTDFPDIPFFRDAPVCAAGDSGSVWVHSESKVAVALLNGGRTQENYSRAVSMPVLVDKLGISLP